MFAEYESEFADVDAAILGLLARLGVAVKQVPTAIAEYGLEAQISIAVTAYNMLPSIALSRDLIDAISSMGASLDIDIIISS